jgi:hypothetical protein
MYFKIALWKKDQMEIDTFISLVAAKPTVMNQ